MRRSLAVGTILRSDDNVASAVTQATLLQLGRWSALRGVDLDFLPCMGGGKDLARCEVLAAFYHRSKAEALLWIDNGNGVPQCETKAEFEETCRLYFDVLLLLEEPIVWGPYMTRGGDDPSFACSLPGDELPHRYLKNERVTIPGEWIDGGDAASPDVRMLRLGGCGFGWTRMRRDVVDRIFAAFEGEAFVSNRLDSGLGELECVDVFSSMRRRRLQDTQAVNFARVRAGDLANVTRPMRLEPEDDSFWHRVRERGLNFSPCALVDLPVAHGRTVGDLAGYYGLPSAIAAAADRYDREHPTILDHKGERLPSHAP